MAQNYMKDINLIAIARRCFAGTHILFGVSAVSLPAVLIQLLCIGVKRK